MAIGLVYDPIYLEHDTGAHIENRERLVATTALLRGSGVMAHVVPIEPRIATQEELLMVHTREHVSRVESSSLAGGAWLDGDTVTSPKSYQVALYAAGGVLSAVDAVRGGEVGAAFALVRPPGHHTTLRRAMGFCLFNNIAIAARYIQKQYRLDRILVVDFDVHHGNGTQEAFYSDPRVLYFSTHQYPFYPGTGAIEEVGEGAGRGTTVNVPLPAWCGDEEYQWVYEAVLPPLARRFQPQMMLVSAGYDAHWADRISLMQLSVGGFARIIEVLRDLAIELCGGQMVLALEGGYHLEALPAGVRATLEVLAGQPRSDDTLGSAPCLQRAPHLGPILNAVKKAHHLD